MALARALSCIKNVAEYDVLICSFRNIANQAISLCPLLMGTLDPSSIADNALRLRPTGQPNDP